MNNDTEFSTPVGTDEAQPNAVDAGDDEMVPASETVFQCEPMNGQALMPPTVDEVIDGASAGAIEEEGAATKGAGGGGARAAGPVDNIDRGARNLSANDSLSFPPLVEFTAPVWVAEIGLAKKLGVGRDVLRTIRERDLKEGTDWRQKGKVLYVTQAAALRMASLIGTAMAADDEKKGAAAEAPTVPAEPAAASADAPGPLLLRDPGMVTLVATATCANPHIVVAVDVMGQPCRVRVRDNRNFAPGMEMPCVLEEGNLYRLGRACPRFRGRW